MEKTLEKLWNEYFAEKCAVIDTKEERSLLKRAAELHETASELLTKEQNRAVEEYVEALYEIQSFIVKKAFFNGCEFAVAFLLECGNLGKG